MQVTKEVNEVIVGALEYARENKHEYVTAEHILYKCTFIEKVQNAMEKCGADIENLRKNLNEYFNEYIKTTDSAGIQESYSFQQVILIAGEQCIASGKNIIEIEHILSVIYMMEDSYALYFLNLEGIDKSRRRILSGYGTSQNGYSKETPEEDLTSVRDILGEMPEEMDDDIMKAIETIDEEVTPQERRDMLETTKDVREMSEEELDYDFNADLEEVMRH